MKRCILFFLVTIFFHFSYGQTYKPYEQIRKYSNGQIKEKGYKIITSTNPPGATDEMLSTSTSKRLGLWEFWYDNGNKMLEIFYANQPKYINMWFSDGKQILKNGNGYYSVYNNEIINNSIANDKVAFIVKDSIITSTQKLLEKPPYIK